jgi:hypothetical protein
MFISLKYVIFYTCVGIGVGYIADGDKRVAIAGAILSAMVGMTFGFSYAILTAVEFGVGFFIGSVLKEKNKREDSDEK